MSLKKLISSYAGYNYWANEQMARCVTGHVPAMDYEVFLWTEQ